jgi:hypothetical protein
MAIDPRMAQNAAQGVFTNSITGGGGVGSYPYTINVDTSTTMTSSRLFAHNSAGSLNNPYHSDDVTEEFIRKLQVYTDAMLVGDIKNVSNEYLWAVQAAIKVLRHAKSPLSSAQIEHYWNEATQMKGSLPEDFAKLIQNRLTR